MGRAGNAGAGSPPRFASAAPAGGDDVSGDDSAIMAPSADSKVPAVFETLDPGLKLDDNGKQRIDQMQQDFAVNAGGNSTTPADAERWQEALTDSDDGFRAWFGDEAFLAQQTQALRHAKNNSAKNGSAQP
jgi:hypothetical protein